MFGMLANECSVSLIELALCANSLFQVRQELGLQSHPVVACL